MKYEIKVGSYNVKNEDGTDVVVNFNYRTDISVAEKIAFVGTVVDCVVTDKHYYDSALDMVFNFALIKFFTDIDTSNVLSKNTNFVEAFISIENFVDTHKNVVDVLKANIREGLIVELNVSVAKDIEYKTGIHNAVFDEVIMDIATTIKDMMSQVDIKSVVEAAQKMNNMQSEFTPEKIIDAYTNTDYFKKTLERNNANKAGDKK